MKAKALFKPACAAALISAAVMLVCAVGCIAPKRTAKSISDEEMYWWHDSESSGDYGVFNLDLSVFPVESHHPKVEQYYYYNRPDLLDDEIQLFMRCSYSAEDYAKECVRLKGASPFCDFDTELFEVDPGAKAARQPVLVDSGLFAYPAVVFDFEDGRMCEYALLNEAEHEVIYVLLQFINASQVGFDSRYLPTGRSGGKLWLP